ncbi:MAG: hypothetical protein R2781_06610 [Flavobacteriaceae bacterium]
MKRISSFFLYTTLCVSCSLFAQENIVKDGNKDISITKVYEQVVKEGYATPKLYLDLANAYYFESNYVSAKKYYEIVFETKELVSEKVLFRYKQSLRALNEDIKENKYLVSLTSN